ncbi:protein Z, vitamin K-dependent plasma glycoprotein b [Myripristis murdjan]|uniref:protein Z, vitamin K-dependent plasma glycoprotein b n=1 Tax=Myripristis murdjan TaxID=586833 RepID=UPI001175E26D|nr:vitamin K-dependent protein Z-like [Myripristis murdjan]
MACSCQASLFSLSLLAGFLQVLSQGAVFSGRRQADGVFLRSKRANSFLVEEILQGNLERECYEELCSYEEAREYFEDTAKTDAFWTVYYDGDQCKPNPCLHDGNCTDKMGGFHCSCSPPHYGTVCELEPAECPTEGPAACHQFCSLSSDSFSCSCTAGFKLQTDGKSCLPDVKFPCGQTSSSFDELYRTRPTCHHGNCPWQVSVTDSRGVELCRGVVLGRRSVLTAASCLFLSADPDRRPSSLHVVTAVVLPVQSLYMHSRFRRDHHDNDLVLLQLARPLPFGPALFHACLPIKDFSENVLMRSGRGGLVGGPQSGRVTYLTLDECRSQLDLSHPISNKMFCMRGQHEAHGSQNDPQGRDGGVGQNETERHIGTRAQTGRAHRDESQGSANGAPVSQQSQNKTQGSQNGTQSQNGAPQSQDGDKAPRNQSRSESQSPSESEVRRDDLLPGTPVATEHKGTVFVTGLLISSHAGRGERGGRGLVFTKLSRHLAWLRQRLELTEDHMTSQVSQLPEHR